MNHDSFQACMNLKSGDTGFGDFLILFDQSARNTDCTDDSITLFKRNTSRENDYFAVIAGVKAEKRVVRL